MSMEKITKDELLEKLGGVPLSDDEMEKIAGGAPFCLSKLVWSDELQDCVPPLLK